MNIYDEMLAQIELDDYQAKLVKMTQPEPVQARSSIGEIGSAFKRGLFVQAPEMIGKAMQSAGSPGSGLYDSGKSIREGAEAIAGLPEMQPSETYDTPITGTLAKGAEGIGGMTPVLAASVIPGIGEVTGPAAAFAIFGGQQYQDTKERYLKQHGLDDEYATKHPDDPLVKEAKRSAVAPAVVQGVGDAALTMIGGRLIKGVSPFGRGAAAKTAEDVLSGVSRPRTVMNLAKDTGKAMLAEGATEAAQDEATAAFERASGLKDAQQIGDQAVGSFQGGVGMAALLAPLGIPYRAIRHLQSRKIEKVLADPSADMDARWNAAQTLYGQIVKVDPEAARNFLNNASDAIGNEDTTGTKPYAIELKPDILLPAGTKQHATGDVSEQGAHEPDPEANEEPPHAVETFEKQEQPVMPETQSVVQEEPEGALTKAAALAPSSGLVQQTGVGAAPGSVQDAGIAKVAPVGRTTDELVLDDARDWAQQQIAAGKTQLMRQVAEHPDAYYKRLIAEYRKSTSTPSVPDSGPKYANVQLVNPETGKAEVVKPEEVADRLSKGWREQGQERAPSPQPPATESILSTVTDADRDALRMAQLRADYWERGSVDNGRSNKTQLFPWLNTWGKTTPAEVGKAIGNFLEGKKLGDVQRRLVEAALEFERENPVPFADEKKGAQSEKTQEEVRGQGEKRQVTLSEGERKKAEMYAEKAGIDLEGWPNEDIAGFVKQYDVWRFAERQKEHITQKLRATKDPKARERLLKTLEQVRQRQEKLIPKGVTDVEETTDIQGATGETATGAETVQPVQELDGQAGDGMPVVQPTDEVEADSAPSPQPPAPNKGGVQSDLSEVQEEELGKEEEVSAVRGETVENQAEGGRLKTEENKARLAEARRKHILRKLAEAQTEKEKERYAKLLEKLQARKQEADFVKTPDGSIDFGKIDTEIRGKDSKVYPAGPIRLEHGGEYGRAHIAESRIQEFKDYGYADELAALKDIASNYTEIYEQPNGRLLLVKRNGRGKYASVELQRAGDYYGVTTWFLEDANPKSKTPYEKRGGRSLLLRVAHADDLGKSSSFPESGTQGQAGNSRRSNQSNDRNNISPSSGKVKNENVNDKTVPSASYGEDNKIFTKDRADKAREILRKKLSQVNTGLDPEMIQAGIDLAGYHIEAGARAFAEYAKRMAADLGEEIRPYLKSFYLAVRNYPGFDNAGMETEAQVEDSLLSKPIPDDIVANEIKPTKIGGEENVERSDSDMERNSGNSEPENGVGEETLSDDGRRDNKGVRRGGERAEDAEFEPGRDPVLPRSEALTPGERGNPQVQGTEQQAESASRAAGSEFGERSGDFDVSREAPEPVTTAAVDKAAARVAELADRRKTQAAAQDVPVVAGDRANIAKSLPVLFPGQLEDVGFAEDRFATPDGYGVMFTNGTGTGKTFSGLGIIKRFERRGKKNIIIVAPSDNVINDWIKSGKNLLLDISPLSSTKDAGSGIVITTYENFGQNEALVKRGWDLVVFDESHKLNSNKSGSATNAQNMMQAITLHPEGKWLRAQLLHKDLLDKLKEMRDDAKSLSNSDFDQNWAEASALQPKIDALTREWESARKAVEQEVKTAQGAARPRVVFLSATPFAYDKNIDYANGYLFDYNEGQGDESQRTGYNSGSKHDRFFMTHFGYRMRYNKLTEPPAEVDQGIMHRQFNSWLKSRKVLSGRMLEVEPDYDRRFILADSAIGRKIDEGLEYLRENDEFRPIYDHVIKKFDYLTRHFLLEAIKAREVIPHIREHMAMGRKVVVFHDYKQGGGVILFDVQSLVNNEGEVQVGTYPNYQTVKMGDVAKHFIAARPDLVKLPFGSYGSALDTLRAEFPDALVVNGDETRRNNVRAAEQFQDDESGRNLIIVQADKGKEGISLHDTTGRHQRVMFNLGLPVKPTMAIQQEGRIYRTGQASNAMMRYLNTGTNWERFAFATTIARRASTAENLASGEQARMLLDAFVQGFEESDDYRAGHEGEGTGGKERDKAANAALTEWDRAITYYFGQQKKTSRNKAQEGVDYFATPEPLGLKMVEWADIRPGDSVLEPSGGHGAIARWFPDQSRRRMIEPSLELSSRAALVFDGDIVQGRFEDHNIVNKYDAIVMNPPFGSGGKTAVDHLEKAARHLKDGGRIVAIIPRGPAADKKFDKWMDGEESRPVDPVSQIDGFGEVYAGDTVTYRLGNEEHTHKLVSVEGEGRNATIMVRLSDNQQRMVAAPGVKNIEPTGKREAKVKNDLYLAADISLPSVTFERAGTKVAARIVVLDKSVDVHQTSRDYSEAATIKEFFDRVEGATIPARQIAQPVEEEQTDKAVPVKTEGGVTLGVFNHTKTGKPLYVATVNDRLDSAAYSAVNAVAKKHKGYYNSYAKNGAIKGFIFDSEANRDAFVEEIAPGEKQAAEENEPVRFALRPDMTNNEALPGLVERGVREYIPGMKYPEFAKRMKTALGDMWERFKGLMLKVWGEVRSSVVEITVPENMADLPDQEFIEKIKIFAREKFAGSKVTNRNDGSEILIPWQGIKHTFSGRITRAEAAAALNLSAMIERARLVRTETDYHGRRNIHTVFKYNVVAVVEGKAVKINITVREHDDGKRYYDHYEIKKRSAGQSGELAEGQESHQPFTERSTGSKISPSGDDVKYALAATGYGLPAADIRSAFEPVYKNLPQAPPWRVVQTAAELPKRALDDAARRGIPPQRLLQAVYLGNEVVYVADHFRSIEEAKQVILEEVVVHHGLRGIMARDTYEKHMLQAALWYANKRTEEWKALGKTYGLDLKSRAGRIEAAEEMLGRDARTGKDSTMLNRIIAAVKEFLRSIGFDMGYGETEIRELLGKARRFVEGKESPAPSPQPRPGVIDYGALLRNLREQGITDEQLQAFAAYDPAGAKYAAAWHGSPHDFEKFLKSQIGTGEGAQAYGYGLYFAGKKEVAEHYKRKLSDYKVSVNGREVDVYTDRPTIESSALTQMLWEADGGTPDIDKTLTRMEEYAQRDFLNAEGKKNWRKQMQWLSENRDAIKVGSKGRLYQVELAPHEDEYLLWDKPLSEQSEKVKDRLISGLGRLSVSQTAMGKEILKNVIARKSSEGYSIYKILEKIFGSDRAASEYLHSLGIRGIKYLDGTSRGKGEGHHNYVIFDESDVSITAKFALARLQDVKGQIVNKGVSLNTTEREVLEADRAKAVEAIGETVKDYDEPGRFLFRAFYESDQDKAPGVVPYNPERGHYAAGENLKGSWWTTSLATAQEIAWSKARAGRPVKIVALPLDKLPNGNVYIQNTNPPGFVYDLFVGLPADVPLSAVREMPVDSGIRYALADRFAGYVGEMQGGEVWKRIARFLNPLDWSYSYGLFKNITPQNIQNGLARVLRDPIGAAEVDDDKKTFVEPGIQRERNKTSLLLRLYGWFGPREKIPNFIERFTKTFTSWHNNDLTTAWGRIVDEYGKLSQDDRKGVDWLLYRGDVDGKVYRTYDMAKGDKKVSRKLPSEAAFNVYLQVRTHIDTTVADTIEEITRQFMTENGMSGEEVEKHIFTYRQGLARHVGWLPRNHGEGNWQVNIYQRITGLKWDIGQYQATKHVKYLTKDGKTVEFERTIDALSAYLPYFPSHDVAKEIKILAKRFGLAYEQENGRQRVYVDKGAQKRMAKAVSKMKEKLAEEGVEADKREEMQRKLEELETTLAFVKDYSPGRQIQFFVKQAAKIIGKLESKNLMSIHRAKENLKQAIEDKESATEIRRLEDELEKLGDGSIKVKVYMRLQGSRRKADKHMKDIQRDMRKAIPENFRENAVYEVKVKFNDRISESTYGDMQNDFAQEQAQLKAIERASSKQEITKKEAAAIRHQIIQSTAEVLMARGAGAHRIQRAEYLIEGYDTENTLDAYQDYMTGTAGMLSKAKYAHDQFENFRYAKPEVKAWAEQYIRDTLRNMGYGDMVSGNLRSLASLAYLGFKVSSMVINATQPWTIGIAHLGMLTKRSPVKAMATAQKDIFVNNLTDDEKRIFASEIWKEQEQKTAVHEMAGSGEGATGKVSRFMHTLTGKALFGFQEVEMLNRKTVILAAYRTFRADGMEHGEALKKALEVNGHVNNEMSRANKPGIAQNPVGNTLFTLQSFTWRTWNWVFNRLTSGKKEDMIALLRYAAAMAIIGGVAALPGGDELDKLYQMLFGESPKLAFQKWTRKHAREYGSVAEMVNGFAWHGLASATGVNISNAMRLQIPIVSPLLSGDSLPEAAGGVFTGLAQKGARAVTAASRGDIYRMIENISPEALAGGMRAYRMATKGATTGTGKVIFDENGRPMKYGAGEAVTRALGFQPSRVSERNELTNVEKGLSAHWKEERGDLLAELRLSKPGEERRKVMLEIIKFNHRLNKSQAKGLIPVIKAQTIKQALSAKPNKSKAEWEREQLGG